MRKPTCPTAGTAAVTLAAAAAVALPLSEVRERFDWRVRARVGLIAIGLITACGHAVAAQLISSQDCSFVMHVPGLLGGKNLNLTMRKGAVFTENSQQKFCGPVSQATPLGESNGNQCFVVADGKLVSGPWSDKVTSSSCALADAAAMQTPFAAGALAPWDGHGPANLHGQAFLKTVGGDVKTCAGARVLLLPATPYVDELLTKTKAGISVQVDPRLMSYSRSTICDAQGSFSFVGLPAQRWYVLTDVTWGVPHIEEPGDRSGPLTSLLLGIPAAPETDQQGGELMQVVTLTSGDNQAFLTYRDEQ